MRQSGDTYSAGVYLSGKLRLADEKKDKLLDVINRLTQLSYEKGTRIGDAAIRDKLKEVVKEIEQYYKMIRAFAHGKGGESYAYQDILEFFNERYLDNFSVAALLDGLKKEISLQEENNLKENTQHESQGHSRKRNVFTKQLIDDLKKWEQVLLHSAEPLLRAFLNDVNDIYLYQRLNARLGDMFSKENLFVDSGPGFQNFTSSIGYYLMLNIKLNRKPLTDKDISDLITQMLQQMGLRKAIMHSRNITPEKFKEITVAIIDEWNLRDVSKMHTETTRGAIDAIRAFEKDRSDKDESRELMQLLEKLIYLGDPLEKPISGTDVSSGTVLSEKERFLFHKPGSFNISIKFVSEYARNSLILVIDFLYKELQKGPSSYRLLEPLMAIVPSVQEFARLYAAALDVSEDRRNQTSDRKGTQQFISREMARDLVRAIKDNCVVVRSGLDNASYKINMSSFDRAGVLAKKISILKESCNETHQRINKGLVEIGTV